MYGNDKDLKKAIMTYYDGTIVILEFNRLSHNAIAKKPEIVRYLRCYE